MAQERLLGANAVLGHGVHEDELTLVHGDEADAIRAVHPALLQDLDTPVLQVRADRLVRCGLPAAVWGPRRGARAPSRAPWRSIPLCRRGIDS